MEALLTLQPCFLKAFLHSNLGILYGRTCSNSFCIFGDLKPVECRLCVFFFRFHAYGSCLSYMFGLPWHCFHLDAAISPAKTHWISGVWFGRPMSWIVSEDFAGPNNRPIHQCGFKKNSMSLYNIVYNIIHVWVIYVCLVLFRADWFSWTTALVSSNKWHLGHLLALSTTAISYSLLEDS